MPAQHSKNIALTGQLEGWVDELVASGEYRSASEVVRDGLRLLKERRDRSAAELAGIRASSLILPMPGSAKARIKLIAASLPKVPARTPCDAPLRRA